VLFGLSMDYQVFLLSRIHERYAATGDTTDAIMFGVGSTARLITGAALIIVVVFAGFASGELGHAPSWRPQLVSPVLARTATPGRDRGPTIHRTAGEGRRELAERPRAWAQDAKRSGSRANSPAHASVQKK